MSSKLNVEIRSRARNAVLRSALLSWQTGLTAAMTLGLFLTDPSVAIPGWQAWFWLVGGLIAEGAWVAASLTDPEAANEAIAREFERRYDLSRIGNMVSRQRMKSALEYRNSMMKLVKAHKGAMRMSLNQTVEDIDDWLSHMYALAQHIDAFEDNEIVIRDRQRVPTEIDATKRRIEIEQDPAVRHELEKKLEQLEQQLTNLNATVNSVKRAEIQLESTLSSLGTVYAQMSLLGTKEVDSARAQRLRLEIQDEVSSLQDTIDAMDEVQNQRLVLR
jgi:predicted RNase H-like nuclease (RuvC/YqgF family)